MRALADMRMWPADPSSRRDSLLSCELADNLQPLVPSRSALAFSPRSDFHVGSQPKTD